MLESIKVKFLQTKELMKEGGVKNVFKAQSLVAQNRLATPVVMDLTRPDIAMPALPQGSPFRFVEIKMEDVQAGKWSFALPSRAAKARYNLKCGLRSFAVVEGSIVVGDVWCFHYPEPGKTILHRSLKDLDMLDLKLSPGDVYAFDMVIAPAYRGMNLAKPLQRYLHASLKAERCQKVYGYFWDDNIPALWMHRMLKYKELPKRSVSRFFFLMQTRKG